MKAISALDRELRDTLRPLVKIGATVRCARFVNTLGLGFHYLLAHEDQAVPPGRIDLFDWNNVADLLDHLHGVFVLYASMDVTSRIMSIPSGETGFFNTLPVTRFRQRYAFVLRNGIARDLATKARGSFRAFVNEVRESKTTVCVYTDIADQAEALMGTVLNGSRPATITYTGKPWPKLWCNEDTISILVYGAPSTEYMRLQPDLFEPLEVDDALTENEQSYQTHVVWHVPQQEGCVEVDEIVRECLRRYHGRLFEAALDSGNDGGFAALNRACGEILGAQHPSFPMQVFALPGALRKCLTDHHDQPRA